MRLFVIGEGRIIKIIRQFFDEQGWTTAFRRVLSKELSTACYTPADLAALGLGATSIMFLYFAFRASRRKDKPQRAWLIASALAAVVFGIGTQTLSNEPIGKRCGVGDQGVRTW